MLIHTQMKAFLSHKEIAFNESISLMARALRLCITEQLDEETAIGVINDELLMNLLITPTPVKETEN